MGYWFFKKFYQFMDYGIIVMECGVSSAIFGILYGSIFGVEHWIPALWFHPAENINHFMKFAIGLGVFMISAGVILNIINSFQRKDYEAGILGHYGIVGGLFYWICVGLGLKYAIHGHLGVSTTTLMLLLAVPLGVIFFREPLGHVLFKPHDKGGKIFPSGIGLFVMEAVIDVMDVIIRYLGNTVSFIRTAAFALAHGGLFIAVFSLADILGQLKGGGLWYWIVIVLGNVVIIALEGLVVSIQTIRLEYYEFFSKFFKGGGERFKPLTIE
jgi:V/A-type H+-transporting ATPase subunit I